MRARLVTGLLLTVACGSGTAATSGGAAKPASVIERLPDPVDDTSFVDVTTALLAPKAKPEACAPESLEKVRERYRRGVELYDADDYERALIEFERDYERCPSVKILYNMALVYVQLNANAKAHALFEKYLAEGEPPPARVTEIREVLARIERRLGWVLVECGEGVEHVFVDDRDLTSLGPCPFRRRLRTDPGRRVVRADPTVQLGVEGSATTAVSVRRSRAR